MIININRYCIVLIILSGFIFTWAFAGESDEIKTAYVSKGIKSVFTFLESDLSFESRSGCTKVFLKNCIMPEDEKGSPWLPSRYVNVFVPSDKKVVSLKTKVSEIVVAGNIDLCPVQPPVRLSAPAPNLTKKNIHSYSLNTKLPDAFAKIIGYHNMRGFTYVSIRLNPVRYNPVLKELYLTRDLSITLELSDTHGALSSKNRSAKSNKIFERMARNIVINKEMLDDSIFLESKGGSEFTTTGNIDYLVITSGDLQNSFQDLTTHREVFNSFTTAIMTLQDIYDNPDYEGVDSQEEIRNCIDDFVKNRNTGYVVLGGDDTIVPVRGCYVSVDTSPVTVENNMPTDLYYAGLDSSWDEDGDGIYGEADTSHGDEGDLDPDVIVGRIPVRTSTQAHNYIDKLIAYEINPPTNAFKEKFIMLGEKLWNYYTGSHRPSDSLDDGYSAFTDHSPVSDAEMWSRRMYRDGIQGYMQADLSYFFDTLTSWDDSVPGDYGLHRSQVSQQLNQGWQNVFFATHGSKTAWALEHYQYFNHSDASALTEMTTIVYTMACLTGQFDGSTDPSLSEAFLRNPNLYGGALAYFGSSRYGWGSPDNGASNLSKGGTSMNYAYEFYSKLLNNPDSDTLGNIFYQHKAVLANRCDTNNSHRWVQFGLNYQGDPAFNPSVANNDIDDDGIEDISDNCPGTSNPDQLNWDLDDMGDACDTRPGDYYGDSDVDGHDIAMAVVNVIEGPSNLIEIMALNFGKTWVVD